MCASVQVNMNVIAPPHPNLNPCHVHTIQSMRVQVDMKAIAQPHPTPTPPQPHLHTIPSMRVQVDMNVITPVHGFSNSKRGGFSWDV